MLYLELIARCRVGRVRIGRIASLYSSPKAGYYVYSNLCTYAEQSVGVTG